MLDLSGVTLRGTGGCGDHVERDSFLERERSTLSDDDDDDDDDDDGDDDDDDDDGDLL